MSPIPTYIEEADYLLEIVYADMSVVGYTIKGCSLWYYKYVVSENKLYTWTVLDEDKNEIWYEVITNGVFVNKDGDPIEAFYGE